MRETGLYLACWIKGMFLTSTHDIEADFGRNVSTLYRVLSVEDVCSFELSNWRIPEPPTDREEALADGLDLLVVPGVAFDRSGRRLGHGRGYYDRYCTKLQCQKIALALREQVVDEVPTGDTDFLMDSVVAPDGLLLPE
eukprot:GEMP01106937.1.p1 GENE.GEMP01106937.1~~GEMP01106937.1.p1  ORF type:complete len:139 (+),score=20.56 GEMP01106937.1:251-667(+)